MARSKPSSDKYQAEKQIVHHLMTAAECDTVYRDLYLQRAVERLGASMSRTEYEQLKARPARLEQLMQATRQAVARQDWNRVNELSSEVSVMQAALPANASDVQLAERVYEAQEVAVDPFSWALNALLGRKGEGQDALRDQLIASLSALEQADRELSAVCAARRGYFATLAIRAAQGPTEGTVNTDDVGQLQQRAAEAAERGDVDELKRITQRILAARPATPPAVTTAEREAPVGRRSAYPADLGEPFPGSSVERARQLGLAHVQLKVQLSALPKLAQEVFDRYGWHPSYPETEVARNGEQYLRPLLEQADIPKDVADPLVEMSRLFALYPFVNCGGVRYFPLFPDEEWVLVEDFPEESEPDKPSALLTALGLARRTGLSRAEIEIRLREKGAMLIRERLGLDPIKFRLVCIPYDVYARLGQEQKWGRQPRWTHVDGYQLLKRRPMRALVAGDIRFGGLFDLCSISQEDEHETALTRFAVIHRERLMVRSD